MDYNNCNKIMFAGDFMKDKKTVDTDARNIAHLCIMCGKCCKAIVTEYSHDEIIEMAKKGEKEADIFVNFFKRYDSIADARKDAPDKVNQNLKAKNLPEDLQGDEVTFYYCDKLNPDNSCSDYENRPSCCRIAPLDCWTLMPPGCGFTGWQFEQREKIKENIRSLKEKIYEVETTEGEGAFIPEANMSFKDFKKYVDDRVKSFERHGSKGW